MNRETETMQCRPPAVAGAFYPGDPLELSAMVSELLVAADPTSLPRRPRALVVPHAGYIYSGGVAAQGYSRLEPFAGEIRRVILLGPNHRVPLAGIAAPDVSCFRTPLGDIDIDQKMISQLADKGLLQINSLPHENEHCLETQLPFLQKLLSDWQLVPLIVGETAVDDVSALLDEVIHDPDNLVIISSDLSHFHEYHEAQRIDSHTSELIETLQPVVHPQQACGAFPLNGLLQLAGSMGLKVITLDRKNSGDTAGGKDQVVGYGCYAFV
jgi:AmmeMemoRadiSam system protein B